jgi:hypothetical protein
MISFTLKLILIENILGDKKLWRCSETQTRQEFDSQEK